MQLPVIEYPKYISPSSYGELETCEYKFYLKRMAGHPYPIIPQTKAMATGIVFDCLAKAKLAKLIGQADNEAEFRDELLEGAIDDDIVGEVYKYSEELYDQYHRNGFIQHLVKEGVTRVELDKRVTIDHEGRTVNIRGIPDALYDDGTPHDWKVNGAFSKHGQSPKPGFKEKCKDGIFDGPHKRYGEPFEVLAPDWARQLTIYNWVFNHPYPFVELIASIDQVAISKAGKVSFVRHRGHITIEYQQKLLDSLFDYWERLLTGDIKHPTPGQDKCFKFNKCCEMAEFCEPHRKLMDAKANGDMLGLKM